MTETPTHDPDLELARQYGALLGEADGRRAAISFVRATAYLAAFHAEIQAAGLCNCPDDDETPLADWERDLLAVAIDTVAEAGRAAEANQDGDGETAKCPPGFCMCPRDCDGETDDLDQASTKLPHYDDIADGEQMPPAVRFNAA